MGLAVEPTLQSSDREQFAGNALPTHKKLCGCCFFPLHLRKIFCILTGFVNLIHTRLTRMTKFGVGFEIFEPRISHTPKS